MLKTKLIHPELIAALALCGHGSKVLIGDGNYPIDEKSGNAKKIYLGLMPGLPTVTDILEAIHSVCEIEKAEVMVPAEGPEPEIFQAFREELGLEMTGCGRWEFYDLASEKDVVIAISSGDKRLFSNILVTIGCA